jgi:RNA polymerase sigma factor (sigma-70 family)
MAGRLIAGFQDYYADLVRYLARRTGDPVRAADIAQDTYVRIATSGADMDMIGSERAYLYRVAGNLAIDSLRRDGRQASWLSSEEPSEDLIDPAPSPEQVAIGRDDLRRFNAALETLPAKARLALLMFRVDGLSHAEIAARLNVSNSMVAKYIGQALRHCRDAMWQDH